MAPSPPPRWFITLKREMGKIRSRVQKLPRNKNQKESRKGETHSLRLISMGQLVLQTRKVTSQRHYLQAKPNNDNAKQGNGSTGTRFDKQTGKSQGTTDCEQQTEKVLRRFFLHGLTNSCLFRATPWR
jgi:hypothetical protein